MAAARINIKNIDFYKFRKLVIDGNRDDYNSCSKEVKSLCDSVQTLNFRDEEFDDESDRERCEEICGYYKQILNSKRIDPTDVRIKSGWWGDHKNAYSAGKLKPQILRDTLIRKTKQWIGRNENSLNDDEKIAEKIDGPGLYVFKHREHQCFQYVGRANKVFARCAEKLKISFEGNSPEPLAALLIISLSVDWDFYFIPVSQHDGDALLRILENDLILKHDSIWPHGLNFQLHMDSLLEVSEFRKSCLRHNWPPRSDALEDEEIKLHKLRTHLVGTEQKFPAETKRKSAPISIALDDQDNEDLPDRPSSALSSGTYTTSPTVTSGSSGSSRATEKTITKASASTPKKKPATRPTSAKVKEQKKGAKKDVQRTQRGKSKSSSPQVKPKFEPEDPDEELGEIDSLEQDDGGSLEGTLERTPSASSLSSGGDPKKEVTDNVDSPATTPRKSQNKSTPKSKMEKSRLPVFHK